MATKKTNIVKWVIAASIIASSITLEGCQKRLGSDAGASGLLSLDTVSGTKLSGQEALSAVQSYCSPENLEGYLAKIAKAYSYNGGYKEHPDSGFQATLRSTKDELGVTRYLTASVQEYSASSYAVFAPSKRYDIGDVVRGSCRSIIMSLTNPQGAAQTGKFGNCAYPSIEVSQGGSMSGNVAGGNVQLSNCVIAKMANRNLGIQYDVALCPNALAGDFDASSGVQNEASFVISGSI